MIKFFFLENFFNEKKYEDKFNKFIKLFFNLDFFFF